MKLGFIRFEFKPQDLWIGAFWRKTEAGSYWGWHLDLWICFLPMVPLHIYVHKLGPARNIDRPWERQF